MSKLLWSLLLISTLASAAATSEREDSEREERRRRACLKELGMALPGEKLTLQAGGELVRSGVLVPKVYASFYLAPKFDGWYGQVYHLKGSDQLVATADKWWSGIDAVSRIPLLGKVNEYTVIQQLATGTYDIVSMADKEAEVSRAEYPAVDEHLKKRLAEFRVLLSVSFAQRVKQRQFDHLKS